VPVDVDLYVSTAGEQIDSVDAILQYDSSIFEFSSVTEGTSFDTYRVTTNETGIIEVSGLIDPDSPAVSGNSILLATISLIPQKAAPNTVLSIVFEGIGVRNDSNIVGYKEGVDVLRSVGNASYTITEEVPKTIESVLVKISLQGREELGTSKARDVKMRILNTYFDTNPVLERTNSAGEFSLTNTLLQNRLPFGSYDVLVKPQGYLQQRFNMPLLSTNTAIDFTSRPFPGGDLNDSGKVNGLDWGIYLGHFNSDEELSDLDGSGKVTGLDNIYLLINWDKVDEE
ncbi:MAG: cohesin domain-containing protein, partial [Acidobacteriota bacterium]